jgi:hypothetical protein
MSIRITLHIRGYSSICQASAVFMKSRSPLRFLNGQFKPIALAIDQLIFNRQLSKRCSATSARNDVMHIMTSSLNDYADTMQHNYL